MKYKFLLFAGLGLFACQAPAKKVKQKKEIDPKVLISCDGIGEVKLTDTHQTLVEKFGKESIVEHENTLYGHFSAIHEGEPKQINVYWKEKRPPFKTINFIEVNQPGSVYMTVDSVRVGLGMRDLVKRNGFMPVTFKNIWSAENGGAIKTFNEGDIQDKTPCLSGLMEQVKVNVVHKDEMKAFREKEWVESSDPLLNRIDMELSAIRIFAKQ